MKKALARSAAAALCLLMVFAAAGCGGSSSKKETKAPASAGSSQSIGNYRPPKVDTKGLLAMAKDGTFVGESKLETEERAGEVMRLTLTIKDHKITDAKYEGFLRNGKPKDIDYGKTNGKIENKTYYNKAQRARKAYGTYAAELVKKQELNKVDGVSGATLSYKAFFDAGQRALEKAGK